MPTAAKLIGGSLLALTALVASYFYIINYPPLRIGPLFYFASSAIGFYVGWFYIGTDPGLGGYASIVAGLRGSFLLVFYSSAIFGVWIVVLKLLRFFIKTFTGVFESWFEAATAYFALISEPNVVLTLIVGGCISGVCSGIANRFWM